MIFLENKIEKFLKENNLSEKKEIQIAFSHISADEKNNYEKFEFIGDAVLNLCIINYIFRNLQETDIGELSRIKSYLVSKEILFRIGNENGIYRYIKYGKALTKGEIKNNKRIISDVVEALIGAIYTVVDYNKTEKFILDLYNSYLKNIKDNDFLDFKSKLQMIVNKNFINILPEYKVVKTKGKEHKKVFFVEVSINNKKYGQGKGYTIKEAEQKAAKVAIKNLNKEGIR